MLLQMLRDIVLWRLLGLFVQLAMTRHGIFFVHKGARGRVKDGIGRFWIDGSRLSLCWLQE